MLMTRDSREDELTSQQRAGFVVLTLLDGDALTTAEIARLTGLSYKGAWNMMNKLVLLPWGLWRDDHGRWRVGG